MSDAVDRWSLILFETRTIQCTKRAETDREEAKRSMVANSRVLKRRLKFVTPKCADVCEIAHYGSLHEVS
jgi:hypothetical protein